MNDALAFLIRHGPLVLFIGVFIEQVGLPIPAAPLLLAAGALVAAGKMNWAVAICAVAVASLLADLIWYQLGRIPAFAARRTSSCIMGWARWL